MTFPTLPRNIQFSAKVFNLGSDSDIALPSQLIQALGRLPGTESIRIDTFEAIDDSGSRLTPVLSIGVTNTDTQDKVSRGEEYNSFNLMKTFIVPLNELDDFRLFNFLREIVTKLAGYEYTNNEPILF